MINPFDQGIIDKTIFYNPYPIYKRLRADHPICWSETKEAWIVTRYKDIVDGLRQPAITAVRSSVQNEILPQELKSPIEHFFSQWLMYQDKPYHTNIKALAFRLFNEDILTRINSLINAKAHELIEEHKASFALDIVQDYAKPLAIHAVCQLFEIPQNMYPSIINWSDAIVNFMQGRGDDVLKSGQEALTAIDQLKDFVRRLIETRLDYLIDLNDKNQADVYISIIANILVDGHEPLANAITNSVNSLCEYPSQQMLIKSYPDVLVSGVNELLRYDAPFQYVVRKTSDEFILNDTYIGKNQRVLFMIASANRDLEIYESPDTLDLQRHIEKTHLSFGFDHHFCLGANLAKLVLKIAIGQLIKQLPLLEVRDSILYRHHSLGSRTLKNLSVLWS